MGMVAAVARLKEPSQERNCGDSYLPEVRETENKQPGTCSVCYSVKKKRKGHKEPTVPNPTEYMSNFQCH